MILMSLSIPGIALFDAEWIKGGICPSGTPFGWELHRGKPGLPVSCPEHLAGLPAGSHPYHPNTAGPSPCPHGSSRCTKIHQTAKMQKAFPALQGGVGREGGRSPPAPSLFLRGLSFLRNVNLSHVVCVTM